MFKLNDNPMLNASQFLVFIGAPHNGIDTDALERMVASGNAPGSELSRELLQQLRVNSSYLIDHKSMVMRILSDRKIISLYETQMTRTVGKVCFHGKIAA